jgi:hypothetical protein
MSSSKESEARSDLACIEFLVHRDEPRFAWNTGDRHELPAAPAEKSLFAYA